MAARQLTALARRISLSDPRDTQEQKAILDELVEVCRAVDRRRHRRASECIDGAMLLLTYLAQMGSVGGRQVIDVVVRLLNGAHECLQAGDGVAQPEPLELPEIPALESVEPAPTLESAGMRAVGDMLLGEILLNRRQVLPNHLDEAMRLQQRERIQLGDALVRLGAVTREQVADALRYQDDCRRLVQSVGERPRPGGGPAPKLTLRMKGEPGGDPGLQLLSEVLLGEVMVRHGIVTREELERGLKAMRATGLRLGEALVSSRACTWQDVERGLELQARVRRNAG